MISFEPFVKALKKRRKRTGQTQEAKDFVVVKIGNAESLKARSIVVDGCVPGEVSRRNDVLERATRQSGSLEPCQGSRRVQPEEEREVTHGGTSSSSSWQSLRREDDRSRNEPNRQL